MFDVNGPLERASEDNTRHDNYGVKLIEMCKRDAMFIANGRLFKDQNIGWMTCKESSLVDYLILAPEAFKTITEFEINTSLDNLTDSNCITADQVNTIVNHLGSLFKSISKKGHDSGKSKPWFNKECKTIWDVFHEVKNRYSVDKCNVVKTLLKKRSKEYKKGFNLNYEKTSRKMCQ